MVGGVFVVFVGVFCWIVCGVGGLYYYWCFFV